MRLQINLAIFRNVYIVLEITFLVKKNREMLQFVLVYHVKVIYNTLYS